MSGAAWRESPTYRRGSLAATDWELSINGETQFWERLHKITIKVQRQAYLVSVFLILSVSCTYIVCSNFVSLFSVLKMLLKINFCILGTF